MKDDPSPQVSTSTSTSAPPDFIMNALQDVLGRATDISKSERSFFPGSTVTPFSNETNRAMSSLMGTLGSQPSDNFNRGQDVVMELLNSPATDPAALAAGAQSEIDRVMPQINSTFGLAGRSGSGLQADAAGRAVTDALRGEQGRLRGLQMKALGFVPGFEGMLEDFRTRDSRILAGIGSAKEQKTGQQIAEDVARHTFQQNEPSARLNSLLAALQGVTPLAGGTTTGQQVQPGQRDNSIWGDILGLGTSLALAPMTGGGSLFGNLFI